MSTNTIITERESIIGRRRAQYNARLSIGSAVSQYSAPGASPAEAKDALLADLAAVVALTWYDLPSARGAACTYIAMPTGAGEWQIRSIPDGADCARTCTTFHGDITEARRQVKLHAD
jgi:hypothetical protein